MVHPVQSVVESLYAAGRCPRLHVNAIFDGVVVPDFIREQWQERLIIDLDSSYPLDLTYSDAGIGADLSFGGYVTRCNFPWGAIYVVADRATGRGIVLDQNMPDSVRRNRPPTAEPLPTGDLSNLFERSKDARAGGPRRPNRRRPLQRDQPAGHSAEALSEDGNDDAQTETPKKASSEGEQEAKRRRAAFKVIDGGT